MNESIEPKYQTERGPTGPDDPQPLLWYGRRGFWTDNWQPGNQSEKRRLLMRGNQMQSETDGLTDAEIDAVLESFDQTAPALQRRIVAEFVLESLLLKNEVDALRSALLPFAAAAGRPRRLICGMTDQPLPDDAALGLGVKVSAWKRAIELTTAE